MVNTFILFVCPPKILHKHCFQFLLGLTRVPGENKNNAYAKFGETNKEYYGIFESGLLSMYVCMYVGTVFFKKSLTLDALFASAFPELPVGFC